MGPKEKYDMSLKEQLYGLRTATLPLPINRAFLKKNFTVLELKVDDQGDYYCEVQFKKPGSQFYRLIYVD